MSVARRRLAVITLAVGACSLSGCGGSSSGIPTTEYLYSANALSNNITQYQVSGGNLTPLSPASAAADSGGPGLGPEFLAVGPSGRTMYLVNFSTELVSVYH